MIEKLENFLLCNVSDDWAPIGEFDGTIEKIAAEEYSRTYVLDVIRELANEGHIEFGAFPGGGKGWEPWNVGIEEAIRQISDGYDGVPGYLRIPDDEIGSSEIFRAKITESGRRRLRELGDPYENYGDPWADDPYLHA
ncbi:hypothetical protein [Nocardia barduliensis]|uniref:hypothetical protein n=1 Tax=Nocardia barduliensis TaxID=2736643 RepID=UPI001572D40E|nr:hypothetical protein [Nocardia barduliensis]